MNAHMCMHAHVHYYNNEKQNQVAHETQNYDNCWTETSCYVGSVKGKF